MKDLLLLAMFLIFAGCSDNKKQAGTPTPAPEKKPETEMLTMPSIPMAIVEPAERANYLSAHYWDNLILKPISNDQDTARLEQYFSNYIAILNESSQNNLSDNIRKSLTGITGDSVYLAMFNFLADKYLYDPNSPYRNDEMYLVFVELFRNNPKLSYADSERLKFKHNFLLKNRVGQKAIDFKYDTDKGRTSLYKTNADYLLLYFNNPGCNACAEVQGELMRSDVISRMEDIGKLKILSIYPDEDLDEWLKHKEEQPDQWIRGYDSSTEIKKNQLYDLKAIPTLYLLDKQKNVILKDATLQQIESYFYNN